MTYECDCGYDAGGGDMPLYRFGHKNGTRIQVAHCPECEAILGTRENTTRGI